jgi:hypothetical protein
MSFQHFPMYLVSTQRGEFIVSTVSSIGNIFTAFVLYDWHFWKVPMFLACKNFIFEILRSYSNWQITLLKIKVDCF